MIRNSLYCHISDGEINDLSSLAVGLFYGFMPCLREISGSAQVQPVDSIFKGQSFDLGIK